MQNLPFHSFPRLLQIENGDTPFGNRLYADPFNKSSCSRSTTIYFTNQREGCDGCNYSSSKKRGVGCCSFSIFQQERILIEINKFFGFHSNTICNNNNRSAALSIISKKKGVDACSTTIKGVVSLHSICIPTLPHVFFSVISISSRHPEKEKIEF